MAKPDPALLDPARYPFHCLIAMRFGDLDINRHLNNVALIGILEDGRARFSSAFGFHRANFSLMVASFSAEFLGQAWYPHPLDIDVAIAHIGRTSFVVQQLARQEDRTICFARSVVVCVADNRPAAIPEGFTDTVAEWMLRP